MGLGLFDKIPIVGDVMNGVFGSGQDGTGIFGFTSGGTNPGEKGYGMAPPPGFVPYQPTPGLAPPGGPNPYGYPGYPGGAGGFPQQPQQPQNPYYGWPTSAFQPTSTEMQPTQSGSAVYQGGHYTSPENQAAAGGLFGSGPNGAGGAGAGAGMAYGTDAGRGAGPTPYPDGSVPTGGPADGSPASIAAPGGIDQMSPGTGEQAGQIVANRLLNEGPASQYWNAVRGRFEGQPSTATNYAEDEYLRFRAEDPQAQYGQFYDNAQRRQQEDIDQAMAARGMFGSSAALDMSSEAATNLRAEEAKNEYDAMMAGHRLGGQLGRAADISALQGSQDDLGWLLGGSDVAGSAGNEELARLMGVNTAGGTAQNYRDARLGDMWNRVYGTAMPTMNFIGQGYDALLGSDAGLLSDALGVGMGQGTEGLRQSYHDQERWRADEAHAANMLGNILGGFF